MITNRTALRPAVLAAILLALNSGCSFLFVSPPRDQSPGAAPGKCTTSQAAPVVDSLLTGAEIVRTVYAASADSSVYENPNQPLSRGADIALGVGFTALFLGSAIYGFSNTASCRKAKHQFLESPHNETREPTEKWSSPPPSASSPPPTQRGNVQAATTATETPPAFPESSP
ncbi:MAG: hypothetical protein ACOY0T_36490 [Myxococcota bacterium]